MSSCIPYKQIFLEELHCHIGLTPRHDRIRYRHIHRKGQNLSKVQTVQIGQTAQSPVPSGHGSKQQMYICISPWRHA